MNQCTHPDTQVINSRPPDAVSMNGNRLYGHLPYPAITIRRRKCKFCGHRFRTIEVPKEFLDSVTNGEPQAGLISKLPLDNTRAYFAAHAPITVKDALDYLRANETRDVTLAFYDYATVFRTLAQMRMAYADAMLEAGAENAIASEPMATRKAALKHAQAWLNAKRWGY